MVVESSSDSSSCADSASCVDSDLAVETVYYESESLLLDHPDDLLRGTNTEVTSVFQHPLAQQIYQLTVLFYSSTSTKSVLEVGNAIHIGDGLFLTSAHLLRMPHENLNRVQIFAYSGLLPRPHLYDIAQGTLSALQLSIVSYLSPHLPRCQVLAPDTDIPSPSNLALLRVTCPSDTPSNNGFPIPTYFPTNIRDCGVQFLGINHTFRLSRSLLKSWKLYRAGDRIHRMLGTLLPGKLSTTRGWAKWSTEDGGRGIVLHNIPATSSASGAAICCGRQIYAIHTGMALRKTTSFGEDTFDSRNAAVPLCTKEFKAFLAREVIPNLKSKGIVEAYENFIEL